MRIDNARTGPRRPATEPHQFHAPRSPKAVCQGMRLVTAEFVILACDRLGVRRERRRMACHIRQIAMYVCHVALRMTMTDIGAAFGRDRSTVAYACHVVEDRRDDREYDEFVSSLERVAILAFGFMEAADG